MKRSWSKAEKEIDMGNEDKNLRKRGRIWHIDMMVNGKRFRKAIGPIKSVAELYVKNMQVKKAKNEFGFLPKDSDLQKLFTEFLEYSKTNNRAPATITRYTAI